MTVIPAGGLQLNDSERCGFVPGLASRSRPLPISISRYIVYDHLRGGPKSTEVSGVPRPSATWRRETRCLGNWVNNSSRHPVLNPNASTDNTAETAKLAGTRDLLQQGCIEPILFESNRYRDLRPGTPLPNFGRASNGNVELSVTCRPITSRRSRINRVPIYRILRPPRLVVQSSTEFHPRTPPSCRRS